MDFGIIIARSAREARAAGRPFAHLLCHDFYDGVETGVGLTDSGSAFRFNAVGDSASGHFRAFVINEIDWPPTTVLGDAWLQFIGEETFAEVRALKSRASYVAVGHPYLEWLVAKPVDDAIAFENTTDGFRSAHRALEAKFVKRRPGR